MPPDQAHANLGESPSVTDLANRRSGRYEIVLFFDAASGGLSVRF